MSKNVFWRQMSI